MSEGGEARNHEAEIEAVARAIYDAMHEREDWAPERAFDELPVIQHEAFLDDAQAAIAALDAVRRSPQGEDLTAEDAVCACLDETGERRVELLERCLRCGALMRHDRSPVSGTEPDTAKLVEDHTWKGIASAAALSLAGIATELQGIRAVMEQQLGGPLADEGGGSGDDSGHATATRAESVAPRRPQPRRNEQ